MIMMLTTLTAEMGWRGRKGEAARSPSRQGWAVVMWRVVVMGEMGEMGEMRRMIMVGDVHSGTCSTVSNLTSLTACF